MEFIREKDIQGYITIKLKDASNTLSMMFGGNGDLYWELSSKKEDEYALYPEKRYFVITKENYEVFLLFDKLYRKIDDCDVFKVDPFEEELCLDAEERAELYERTKKMNDDLSDSIAYRHLCSDTSIVWHSDDAPYGVGNCLAISRSRDKERYLIEIKKGKDKENFTVEISNSGSRYSPFNVLFMELYNALCDIDPNYHQIHVEEILYQKRLAKTKKETK